ncbi:prenyltransferase [Spinactinospora alkalitolerans]|uniref:prenyltransferase n=1 Tax=Spinactinospora alkalitolerans TaxID=687207 RepID=UPI0015C890C3|nr:prenyltransferase [Spinactinospora alkalitolerans]
MTPDTLHLAQHFIMRNARLIDRYRFAFFQSGPAEPVRSVLAAYRNVDGGYGNGLEPDLRGHGSQPQAAEAALRILDELGPVPRDIARPLCAHLTSITRPDGGLPQVLPSVRHTEAAPWWREHGDFTGSLNPTAAIAGLLHKHHITHPWRDRATAFCWTRIAALRWTNPYQAIAVCTFLQHAPDRTRAKAEFARLAPMIRAVIQVDPDATGHVHTPLDLAEDPDHIARELFTDAQIDAHLDALIRAQDADGGWHFNWESWCPATVPEWRGLITLQRLRTLRAYGRLDERAEAERPAP